MFWRRSGDDKMDISFVGLAMAARALVTRDTYLGAWCVTVLMMESLKDMLIIIVRFLTALYVLCRPVCQLVVNQITPRERHIRLIRAWLEISFSIWLWLKDIQANGLHVTFVVIYLTGLRKLSQTRRFKQLDYKREVSILVSEAIHILVTCRRSALETIIKVFIRTFSNDLIPIDSANVVAVCISKVNIRTSVAAGS